MSLFDPLLRQLTFANQLTLLRLVAVPGLALALLYGQPAIAFFIFVGAAITDRLDGMAARRFGQTTTLGAFLDPAADKLLMLVAYVVLAMPDQPRPFPELMLTWHVPPALTVLVVLRDLLIVVFCAGLYLQHNVVRFPPTSLGKWTCGFEMGTAGAFLLANAWPVLPSWLLRFGAWSTGALVIGSGVQYLILMGRRLREI